MLFVFCDSVRVTPMFVSSTLRGVLLSLFCFAFGVSLPFAVRLVLSIAPVSGTCFPTQGFLSFCRSLPLRLSAASPLFLWSFSGSLVYLSFLLEFAFFFGGLPCLLLVSLLSVVLTSSLLRLIVLSFVAVGSGVLSYTLCSPFFAAMALPCASSGFPVSLVLFCLLFP